MGLDERRFFGERPQINMGRRVPGIQPFYRTDANNGLLLDMTIRFGYGRLSRGTILGIVEGNTYDMVPVATIMANTDIDGAQLGTCVLTANASTAATAATVSVEDAAKFLVGDHVILNMDNSGLDPFDGGAITAVNYDTGVITFTNALDADYTIAKNACLYHHTGGASAKQYVKAVCILDRDVDTGMYADQAMMTEAFPAPTGQTPVSGGTGALASALFGGAIVMAGLIQNRNANIDEDLLARVHANYYIVR